MKELIIYDGKTYCFRKGDEKRKISKREVEQIFKEWKKENYIVHREYGRFTHIWIDNEKVRI